MELMEKVFPFWFIVLNKNLQWLKKVRQIKWPDIVDGCIFRKHTSFSHFIEDNVKLLLPKRITLKIPWGFVCVPVGFGDGNVILGCLLNILTWIVTTWHIAHLSQLDVSCRANYSRNSIKHFCVLPGNLLHHLLLGVIKITHTLHIEHKSFREISE